MREDIKRQDSFTSKKMTRNVDNEFQKQSNIVSSENPTERKRTSLPSKDVRQITVEELQQHTTASSLWITVDNKVYDVTHWAKHHPGGVAAIRNVGGRDASDLMRQLHRPEVWENRIKNWFIGNLVTSDSGKNTQGKAMSDEFRQLGRWLEDNGWFISDKFYYVRKMTIITLMLAIAWYLFFDGISNGPTSSPKWTFYLSAFILGLFWQQSNFIGHDVGHGSVVRKKLHQQIMGHIVGNLFTGLSITWWKHTHETHHVNTNVISHDPDIQHLPVFAVSNKIFQNVPGKGPGIFSSYWNKYMPFDSVSKFFVGYQHILFLPIMSVARINLLIQSFLFTMTHPKSKGLGKLCEITTMIIFYIWWGYMLYLCPTWRSRAIFWYIANATVGIIHVQICLSHFLMETFDEVPYKKNSESYFEYQLRTTLDVDCPRYMDWFHGGLQYQTIHHLYPRIPRHRLRELRKKVEKIIAKYSEVNYVHYSFTETITLTLKHMKNIAMEASSGRLIPLRDTMIFEALNAIG